MTGTNAVMYDFVKYVVQFKRVFIKNLFYNDFLNKEFYITL